MMQHPIIERLRGFNTNGTATWQQTLTGLTPGATYNLLFDMASEGTFSGSQSITVDFPTGSSTAAQTFTAAPSPANYWRDWEQKSMNFVATDSSVALRFSATTPDDVGLDFVRVNLAAVPEPASLALLGGGGVALTLGYAWRRRRASVAA